MDRNLDFKRRAKALTLASLAAVFSGGAAAAQADLTLALDLGPDGSLTAVPYTCTDGSELVVRYVTAGSNSLALIPLKGEVLIFAGVVAGSGARYVSGALDWHSKGDEAILTDELGDAEPLTCNAQPE
ncbi:MliC family protein [Roseovarius nanhaiticus]|uniref:Membrane-bound inhibitor of C-type lysozyme n=1 Tax=Roseovarius nanhaiticus TaxID=573024 RepID=A0A1N7GWE1_9RHOB|nr:MliC family protein [Roseovarius nanhaiticus]SEL32543.1 Membrane-bound inhibitor of C-type lysozyme [Roseovarius nanhaiticus]SIS16866.1 Membrane-bound inhibitor of C-type lysozyme [Roseovarius nanhaiticus]